MEHNNSGRVVVTGLGIITAIGTSVPAFKQALFDGKCGIGPVSLFDTSEFTCHTAAQINHELSSFLKPHRTRRMSRCDMLGMIAGIEAITDSGLDFGQCNRNRIGIVMGGGAGGMHSWEKFRRDMWTKTKAAKPSLLLPVSQASVSDLIAAQYKLTGTRSTMTTACSSSSTCIGYGFDLIRTGVQDIVIAGGSEALSELTFTGFNALRQVDPLYCRPFDKNRQGLSLGEGAAVLVLENLDHALKRDASIYAEVLGYAINSDAYHMTSPHPKALGMTRVIHQALEMAGIQPEKVDYINAHGTGTKKNDQAETMAIKQVFGPAHSHEIPLSSIKSMVGHCLGSAGAVEAVATVLAIMEKKIPPTIHLDTPDENCDLNYTPNRTKPAEINVAISNSFAFGGNNTCIVMGKAQYCCG